MRIRTLNPTKGFFVKKGASLSESMIDAMSSKTISLSDPKFLKEILSRPWERLERGLSTFIEEGRRTIDYVYTRTSRVIRGTETLTAVRLDDGTTGWISSETGQFQSEKGLRELMRDVDLTSVAALNNVSMLDLWDRMSVQERAKLAETLDGFDWDLFWTEIGSEDEMVSFDESARAYMDLLEMIGDAMEWDDTTVGLDEMR